MRRVRSQLWAGLIGVSIGLILLSLAYQVSSDGAKDSQSGPSRLAEEDIERIADRLGERSFWRKKTQGFHVTDFLGGMVATSCVLGFILWRKDYSVSRLMTRKQKGETIQALKDMDTDTLRKVLGDVNLPSWVNFPDFERVNWANLVIGQMWPSLSAYLQSQAHPQLDPLLAQNKPAWMDDIKLVRFELGETAPQVSGVKVYQKGEAQTEDEIIVEFDFMWSGQQDVEIIVKPIPRVVSNWLIGIGKLLATLIKLKVCMQRLIINGRLRVTLTPLMNKMPIVGAAQFSLVQMPEFSFDLDVLGGDVTLLPGLEAWLNSFIASTVLRPYVLPDKYVLKLTDAELGIETPKGILFVTLIEASNVPRMDFLSKSDPYVIMGVRASRMSRSQVINNDLHPKWNEDFKLLVHEPEHQVLRLVLYDHDTLDKDDEIGEAKLAVKDLKNQEEKDIWLDISECQPDQAASHRGALGKLTLVKDKASDGVAAVRKKLGRNKDIQCRVHLKVTYYEFHKEEVDAAMEGHKKHQLTHVPSRVENKEAFNILMGGVLYVRPRKGHDLVKKNFFKGGWLHSTAMVQVSIAGHTKKSAQVDGSHPAFSDVIEFILGADDIQDPQEKYIQVEVWDHKFIKHFRGRVDIPLKSVLDNGKVKDKYRLKEVKQGELELEVNWYSVLDQKNSP
ncbi:g6855 [Coccomyxa viridis]|uniref:G6855 protein n=1 Tax=Coccomyxa viridis TaxID=1274662 RepID=A0ABP1FWE2_9CHLO